MNWDLLWSWAGRVVTLNVGLAVTNAPLLLALALVDAPLRYPVFFALLSLSIGPSVAAAFGVLDGCSFTRAYVRFGRRALGRWTVVVAVVAVLTADIVFLHDHPVGALLVPMFAVLTAAAVAVGLLSLAMLVSASAGGVRPAVWASMRRWPLTLLNLAVLTAAVTAVNMRPVLALAVVPGCALVVVWHNCRAQLTSLTAPESAPPAEPPHPEECACTLEEHHDGYRDCSRSPSPSSPPPR